ncbi:MAG: squalene synthase HpnC [Bryobacterales bacterium]|nr:squalene synthase HpnC [Bryobacteraceae bacterium]MDW8131880.1 squalene synthase HpnC [Bryobacterales bacterium]
MFLYPRQFLASPEALGHEWTRSEAEAYTRWLACSHYENFHVVTILLPRVLRQDFYNLYAYCRWADDLGDELEDPAESLRRLQWWEEQLEAVYRGRASHPVFIALRRTIERHELPKQPLADLLTAFRQDQTVRRYRSWDELLAYCRYSANPVGRLVLHLCGYRDRERQQLSDATCTGLQLANFWQDVSVDLAKDRVYLPLEAIERHGYSLAELFARRVTPAFRSLMREAVARARGFFLEGMPLAGMVDRHLAVDIELFTRGGLRLLELIEARNYDVLTARPVLGRVERLRLLLGAVGRRLLRPAA